MKVRCVRLLDAFGRPQNKSEWLTVGKIYHVLEILCDTDRTWKFRMVGDGLNGLALFRLEGFEVISQHIAPNWVIAWGANGFFELSPEPWSKIGFWDRYYDRDPNAIHIFEEEKKKIIEADP